jgi:hypothetical protein
MKVIRTTNSEVPKYWMEGRSAKSNNGQFSTDGNFLYSYSKRIGATTLSGDKVVFDYTAPAGHKVSMTTSQHVGLAKRTSATVMNPSVSKGIQTWRGEPPF